MIMRGVSLLNRRRWAAITLVVLAQELAYALLSRGEYDYPLAQVKVLGASTFRLLLELQLAYVITLLPPTIRALALTALHFVLMVATVVHQESGLIPTLSLVRSNASEGAAALGAGVSISALSLGVMAAMLVSLVASIWLLTSGRPRKSSALVILLPTILLGSVDGIYVAAIDPPSRIRSFVSPKRLMLSYGYLGYLAVDAHFMAFSDTQGRYEAYLALQRLESSTDGVQPIDRPTSIYIVQWESLDERALFLAAEGSPLARLWAAMGGQYMLTEHHNGSADTDYSINTGLPAPLGTNPYLLKSTGREFYLPRVLKARGYDSIFVHCNTPGFFSRGRRIGEFGYETVFWSDSFKDSIQDGIFSGINDGPCVRQLLDTVTLKTGQFIYFVTLTSHYPYRNLPESRALSGSTTGRYAVEIDYAAAAVAALVGEVPQGSLVVIFGDHPALGLGGTAGLHRVPLMCGIKTADGGYEKCFLGVDGEITAWSLPRRIVAMLGATADSK